MARIKQAPVKTPVVQSGKCWAKVLKVYRSTNKAVKVPRIKPGTSTPRKADRYKTSFDEILLKKAPFARLIKEISQANHPGIRYQSTAIEALRTVAEEQLANIFADSKLCAEHAKRSSVSEKDMKLACRLRR